MYRDCWEALHNYFLPSAKLSGKHREGAKYRRQHDAPQTPCERLLKSRGLSAKAKKELRERRPNYNPRWDGNWKAGSGRSFLPPLHSSGPPGSLGVIYF